MTKSLPAPPYMDNHTQLWGYKNAKALPQGACDARGRRQSQRSSPRHMRRRRRRQGRVDPRIRGSAASIRGRSCQATLTQAQADAFKMFMAPVTDSRGRTIYPGSPIATSRRPTGRRAVLSAGSSPQPRRPIPPRPNLGARRRRSCGRPPRASPNTSISTTRPSTSTTIGRDGRTDRRRRADPVRRPDRNRRRRPAGTARALLRRGQEAPSLSRLRRHGDFAIPDG